MEKDKNKVVTAGTLIYRIGGLVITLPIAITLGLYLIGMIVVLPVQLFNSPHLPANLFPFLIAIIGICLFLFRALLRATFKYTDGIGNLVSRLHGMHQEQARVERLMTPENQQANDEVAMWLDDESQQHMKKR
jgi:uncharacterized membrane protein